MQAKQSEFKTIGLIGKPEHCKTQETLVTLYHFLIEKGLNVFVDNRVADRLALDEIESRNLVEIGESCDLAIVVGGDGYMLGAARVLSKYDIAVIGVNRGNLGFLTDLSPLDLLQPLTDVLEGHYQCEKRFLLEVKVFRDGEEISSSTAVNEVVLHATKIVQMIEFEVYVNNNFMINQRADGLIVSTPTGSTAYSLSGGGSIMMPSVNAISLLSMFPHTLNSRPIMIDSSCCVNLKISNENSNEMQVSSDSHVNLTVLPGDDIYIKKTEHSLKLVHPLDYNYFNVLKTKLGWGQKLF